MSSSGRTLRNLTAIKGGAVAAAEVTLEVELELHTAREALSRLRPNGDAECAPDGHRSTVPCANPRRILDTLETIESDPRAWSIHDLAMVSEMTVAQVLVITATLVSLGLIEQTSATAFRMNDTAA